MRRSSAIDWGLIAKMVSKIEAFSVGLLFLFQ